MNFIIRDARLEDIKGLQELSKHFHLCSLNPETKNLEKKIKISEKSFKNELPFEKNNFLFVLEDLSKNKIIGTSQIFSEYGNAEYPYHYYSLINNELKLEEENDPATHFGGLLLHPEYRSTPFQLGKQISLIRFLFIAGHIENFGNRLEICLTAPLTKNNESLFWKHTGKNYIPFNYKKVTELYQRDSNKFYSYFKKGLTIPLKDIPKEALEVLGKVHERTKPVHRATLKLGFKKLNRYHILDGGISLEILKQEMNFIKNTKEVFFKKSFPEDEQLYLWGQSSSYHFKGGLVKGTLKNSELLIKTLPRHVLKEQKVFVTPLH